MRAHLTTRGLLRTYRAKAQMAELVDALVSGTSAARRGGSSPLLGTSELCKLLILLCFLVDIKIRPHISPHYGYRHDTRKTQGRPPPHSIGAFEIEKWQNERFAG